MLVSSFQIPSSITPLQESLVSTDSPVQPLLEQTAATSSAPGEVIDRIRHATLNAIPNYPACMCPGGYVGKLTQFDVPSVLNYLNEIEKRNHARKWIKEKMEQQGVTQDVHFESMVDMAVSKLGLGTCGELAAGAARQLIPYHTISIISSCKPKDNSDNHCFLLINLQQQDQLNTLMSIKNITLKTFLANIPSHITIVDLYYQFYGKNFEVETKCPSLHKISELGFVIFDVARYVVNSPNFLRIAANADALAASYTTELPTFTIPHPEKSKEIELSLKSILNSIHPRIELPWIFNRFNHEFSCECPSERKDEVVALLNQKGIACTVETIESASIESASVEQQTNTVNIRLSEDQLNAIARSFASAAAANKF